MIKRFLAVFAVVPGLCITQAPARAQDQNAASNWAEIAQCATIAKDKDRLSCVDAVLERAGVLASVEKRTEARVAESRETFGLNGPQREAAVEKATVAPAPVPQVSAATPIEQPADQPAPPEQVDSISTTIAKAFDPGNRLMVFVTAEGQVWQQSELKGIGLPPRAGTSFTIEKNALGGFMCQVGKYKVFRCKRQA